MQYNEINFHKINRRPVTDTTYQIAAEEWNALGAEVSDHKAQLESGGGGGSGGSCSCEELTAEEIDALLII